MKRPFPEVIVGPETKRIHEELSKRPRPKSITAEQAKRQVELHLESARRNLLMADHKIRPRLQLGTRTPTEPIEVKIEIPKVIMGPETQRILKELATMPRLKSMTAEEAKRQTEIHLESARRNLLQADRKNPPA